MIRAAALFFSCVFVCAVFPSMGCNNAAKPPPPCPKASAAPEQPLTVRMPSEMHHPAGMDGDFEVTQLKPHGRDAAPPATYLLPPEERENCPFLRVVLSFDKELLTLRYDAACIDKDKKNANPVPVNWCSTRGNAHVQWGSGGFTLPVPALARSNVQRIGSYAPGAADAGDERIVWSCKFGLAAGAFEILEQTKDRVRLHAVDSDAEWVLERTHQPDVDPDDTITALRDVLHKKAEPAPTPAPK